MEHSNYTCGHLSDDTDKGTWLGFLVIWSQLYPRQLQIGTCMSIHVHVFEVMPLKTVSF